MLHSTSAHTQPCTSTAQQCSIRSTSRVHMPVRTALRQQSVHRRRNLTVQASSGIWTPSDDVYLPHLTEVQAISGAPAAASASYDDHRPRTPPPDLPSLLLDSRIVYLGMPLVPAVSELVICELLYLQYKDRNKPIYLYINSTGTTRADGETVGFETEGTSIFDTMCYVKNEVYTVGVGVAIGQSCMLLSAGHKGKRYMLPHATAMLHQPRVPPTGQRQAIEIHIKWKEVLAQKQAMLNILSKTTGHSMEKLDADMQRPLYMQPQDAIEYGIVDGIVSPQKTRIIDDVKSADQYDKEAGLVASYLGRARELDVGALLKHKGLNQFWRLPLGRDMVLFALDQRAHDDKSMPANPDDLKPLPRYPYMMAFDFGSVVLVNVEEGPLRTRALQAAADCTDKPQLVSDAVQREFQDDYYILESKGYPNKPRVADDTVMLDTLDVEYLSTVCKVTGMSVALEYWHRLTDELLSKLHDINKDAEKTGTFDRLYGRRQLVEMVALVNIINTNMLYRMRVLDKHRYAWRDEDVDTLWGRLAVELDMVPRCDSLTSKLDLLQSNLRYFLELAHNRKSYGVEFSIVCLIAFDILLHMYETAGGVS